MPKERITALAVEARNFHRLSVAELRNIPGKGLVRVTGKNRAGKSTVLESIDATLAGAGAVAPMPIKVGTSEDDESFTRLRLSNGFTLTRKYSERNPKGYLTIEGPDGGKHGQGKLDGWAGPLSFDPIAFFGLKPERQNEIVLSLGKDPQLPQRLQVIREQRKAKYDERTPWISQKRKAAQATKPEGERPQPIDVSAEMRTMGELQARERERQDAIRAHDRAVEAADRRHQDQGRQLQADHAAADSFVTDARNELDHARHHREDLELKLAAAREAEALAGRAVVDAVSRAGTAAVALEAWSERTVALPREPDLPADPAAEMDEVRARIEQADAVLESIEPWKAWDRARAELEEATNAVDALTDVIGQLDVQEADLVRSSGIPLPGVSFAENGSLLLNGFPLELASGAERIELAVRVAIEVDPELGIVLIDEANDVDLDGLTRLHDLAVEHGFQLWACRLGLEGDGEIVVEDGHARSRDAEPVPA